MKPPPVPYVCVSSAGSKCFKFPRGLGFPVLRAGIILQKISEKIRLLLELGATHQKDIFKAYLTGVR
jgi:hypothetical protein